MPDDIFSLSSELTDAYARLRPIAATFAGIAGHDDRWGDLGPEGEKATAAELRAYRDRIAALEEPADRWQRLAARIALAFVDEEIDFYDSGDYLLELNSIASTFQDFKDVFDVMNVDSAEDWSNVAARMESMGEATDGYRRTLEAARAAGRTVARRQVEAVVRQGRAYTAPDGYFTGWPDRLAASGAGDPALRERMETATEMARRALADLTDYLELTYLPDAGEKDAVGEERYLRKARQFLGMDIDPHETYAWGWEEVARIRADMERLAGIIAPGSSVAETAHLLQTDPDRCSRDRDHFVAVMEERLSRALDDLDGTHFDVPAAIRAVSVKIAPEGGSLGAYYHAPSEDYSRPGSIWYSLGDVHQVPFYDNITTNYHEGFPGHHLQVGVQTTLGDRLSRLHRILYWKSGYGEGWALYSEEVMHELGYLDKPDYVFGLRAGQMLRACRVVIDIGSHLELAIPEGQPFHPGEPWSFATAVEMLVDYATAKPPEAESEVTRYLGWPGQAISYKVGERVIRELRDELRRAGDFDQKAFHAAVLGSGPVPLEMLRDQVVGQTGSPTS